MTNSKENRYIFRNKIPKNLLLSTFTSKSSGPSLDRWVKNEVEHKSTYQVMNKTCCPTRVCPFSGLNKCEWQRILSCKSPKAQLSLLLFYLFSKNRTSFFNWTLFLFLYTWANPMKCKNDYFWVNKIGWIATVPCFFNFFLNHRRPASGGGSWAI